MASPVPQPVDRDSAAPVVHPPDSDPVAIRACLHPDVAAVFDAAKQSKDLVGVRELLQHWRLFAAQELREPGAYHRVLATAARVQAIRKAPAGSVSGEEMRARIDARLAETALNEADRR